MFARSVAAAYRDWVSQIGVIATIAGLVSFVSRAFEVSLAEPILIFVSVFREFFHPILDGILSPFKVSLAPTWKDAVLVWMAIGGAVGRTVVALYRSNDKNKPFISNTRIGNVVRFFFRGPIRRGCFVAASILLWPALVFFGLRYPTVAETQGEFTALPYGTPTHPAVTVKCDLRVVLATQLATAVAAVIAVLVASELLLNA